MPRPLSDQQRRWLTTALGHWMADELISAEQSQRILESYETPEVLGQRKRRLASLVMSMVAASLVGLAALVLVAHHWDAICDQWNSLSATVRLAAIFVGLGASQALAVLLWRNPTRRLAAEVAFVLNAMLYGAAIVLVAQVFRLGGHWPDALFWWTVGVLPVALCLDSLAVHVVLAGVLGVWAGGEVIGFPYRGSFWGLFPNGAYTLVPIAALGLLWSYRRGSKWGVNLYVTLLGWWIVVQAFSWGQYVWHNDRAGLYFIAITAPILLVLAENHRRGSPFARPYHVVGGILTLAALVPMTFYDFHAYHSWWYYGARSYDALAATLAVLCVIVVGAALLFLIRPWTAAEARRGSWDRLRELAQRHWAPLAVSLGSVAMAFWWLILPEELPLPPTLLGNALLVLLAVWLLMVGLREERGGLFAWGVCCLLVWAISRMVDVVDYSSEIAVFGAAALLLVCGGALFGLALLWRHRKSFVRTEPEIAEIPPPVGATSAEVFRFGDDAARLAGPRWLDATLNWLAPRRTAILAAAAGLQLIVLLWAVALATAPLVIGQTVQLAVSDVTPLYNAGGNARLEYAIAKIPAGGIAGLPDLLASSRYDQRYDETPVYIALEPDAGTPLWRAAGVSARRPPSGLYIRGTLEDRYGLRQIRLGIEDVRLPPGSRGTYYAHQSKTTAVAEVAVAPWGAARVRGVTLGPSVPRQKP